MLPLENTTNTIADPQKHFCHNLFFFFTFSNMFMTDFMKMVLSVRLVSYGYTPRTASQRTTCQQCSTTIRPMSWSMDVPSTWACGIRQVRFVHVATFFLSFIFLLMEHQPLIHSLFFCLSNTRHVLSSKKQHLHQHQHQHKQQPPKTQSN